MHLKLRKYRRKKMCPYLFYVLNVEKKHPLRECPLNNIKLCGICVEQHSIEKFSSLPKFKEFYQGESEEA